MLLTLHTVILLAASFSIQARSHVWSVGLGNGTLALDAPTPSAQPLVSMKLAAPFIQLPLRFDAQTLAAEIDALGDTCWMPHPQGFPGNSMLPLIVVDG